MDSGALFLAEPEVLNFIAIAAVFTTLLALLLPLFYETRLYRTLGVISRMSEDLSSFLDDCDEACVVFNQGRLIAANNLARQLLNLPTSSRHLSDTNFNRIVPTHLRPDFYSKLNSPHPFICHLPASDLTPELTIYGRPFKEQSSTHHKVLLRFKLDVTPERNPNFLRLIENINQLDDGAVITDLNLNICAVNQKFTDITGYSDGEVINSHISRLRSDDDNSDQYKTMWKQIYTMGHWSGKLWNKSKTGEKYLQHLSISEIRDAQGETTHYLGLFSDLSRGKNLSQLPQYDPFSLLPDLKLLEETFLRYKQSGNAFNFILVDIHRFSIIQNTFGSQIADAVIETIYERLKSICSETDTVSRIGKDEFGILCGSEKLYTQNLIQKALNISQVPIKLDSTSLSVSVNIGLAFAPQHGESLAEITSAATMAMRNAQNLGTSNIGVYSPELKNLTAQNLQLETYLRDAIGNNELSLHYQPIFNREREPVKVEALLRWNNSKLGNVSPAQFIPVAEQSGLIKPIGDWVIREACKQHNLWKQKGLGEIPIAINISSSQLNDSRLVEKILNATARNDVRSSGLIIEITESVLMEQLDTGLTILQDLSKSGLTIAIDDFGTGYSSLAYLKEFPARILKIDRTFINSVTSDEDTRILDSIMQLAKSLDMQIVAEGVENTAQLVYLQKNHCDFYQGFLLAKPMPAHEVEHRLTKKPKLQFTQATTCDISVPYTP